MRKSNIVISLMLPVEKEDALLQIIVDFVTAQKAAGNLDGGKITTQEKEIPVVLEI